MLEIDNESKERIRKVPKDAYIFAASPPTAGKTTQAIFLSETTKARLVRGKDIVPELSHLASTSRDLIPDEIFLPRLEQRLQSLTDSRIIFDNIPRTLAQAELLKTWAERSNTNLHIVELDLSEKEVRKRIQERQVCPQCGESFHPLLKPSSQPNICDIDGSKLLKKGGDDLTLVEKSYSHHLNLRKEISDVLKDGTATFHSIPASGTVYETARRMFISLSPHIFYKPEMAEGYFKLRDVLDANGFRHIFISGMPVFMYGGRALMKDFDILVPDNEIEQIASALGFMVGVKDSSVAYTRFVDIAPGVEIVSNLRVKVNGLNIPFSFDFLDEESKSIRFMGLPCKIMGLEDLILFKAALGRLGPDDWGKHKDDLSDIEGLIGAQNVDWRKLLKRARELKMEERLREKIAQLGKEIKVEL